MHALQPNFAFHGGLLRPQRGTLYGLNEASGRIWHRHAQLLCTPTSLLPSPSTILPFAAPMSSSLPSSSSSRSTPRRPGPCGSTALPDSKQESSLPSKDVLATKGFWERKGTARFLLLLVSVFCGTYGPAVRYVYEQPDPPSPSILTLARKALSLLFFICFLPLETSLAKPNYVAEELVSQEQNFPELDQGGYFSQLPGFLTDVLGVEWLAALELGLWTFLGTACQTDGLENTSATRAGFFLQSITVLVPVLSTFSGVRVKRITWVATIVALLGLTAMQPQLNASVSISWSTLSSNLDISKGDLEIFLAAFFYALCTLRLGKYAAKVQAIQWSTKFMVISTCLAASWVLLDHTGNELQVLPCANILLAIIFSALVPGTLASLGQTIGQKVITAAEAQVYFSLQPFFSAIFAAVILKEEIDRSTWVAGLVLFIATSIISMENLANKQD